ILLHAKPGERVRAGQALMSLRTDEPERFARAEQVLEGSWEIAEEGRVGDSAGVERRVILDRISAE
ncbi:thymidine phosphorylase, partial [Amycolatopsis sp. H6(2020)]|nr:thymidine phosphorylase [Amycolatopsis sp. H6(2020)]